MAAHEGGAGSCLQGGATPIGSLRAAMAGWLGRTTCMQAPQLMGSMPAPIEQPLSPHLAQRAVMVQAGQARDVLCSRDRRNAGAAK